MRWLAGEGDKRSGWRRTKKYREQKMIYKCLDNRNGMRKTDVSSRNDEGTGYERMRMRKEVIKGKRHTV